MSVQQMTKRLATPDDVSDQANPAAGIKGHDVDGEPVDPAKNFYICPRCKQAVDMRELEQLYHHEIDPDHKPIPYDA
jgi:hypothetical protein